MIWGVSKADADERATIGTNQQPRRTEHDEGLAHAVVGGNRVLLLEVAAREDGGARKGGHVEAQLLVVMMGFGRFGGGSVSGWLVGSTRRGMDPFNHAQHT